MAESTFLGIDVSTQQVKLVVLNQSGTLLHTIAVNYETDLGAKLTTVTDSGEVLQNAATWRDAIFMAFDRLHEKGSFDMRSIRAISGAGQQHGSVYYTDENFDGSLNNLAFGGNGPIWMDSSTDAQCRAMTAKYGRDRLKKTTGSYAFPRFTGSQILKRANSEPFKRISLVSSFAASILTNKICPPDFADASGMNLLDIQTHEFDAELLKICGISEAVLGNPVSGNTNFGRVTGPLAGKYEIRADVIAFTGDNPSALVGCGAIKTGDCVMSLGTSDTIFVNLAKVPDSSGQAHIFCSPIDDGAWMALTCYRNGSLAREKLKPDNLTWDQVSDILRQPIDTSKRQFSIDFFDREITPALGPNLHKTVINGNVIDAPAYTDTEKIFNSILGQFIIRKAHMNKYLQMSPTRLILTGGASANEGLLQLVSNVFQCQVFVLADGTEAAAIGGAYRAIYAVTGELPSPELVLAATPDTSLANFFGQLVADYCDVEQMFLNEQS